MTSTLPIPSPTAALSPGPTPRRSDLTRVGATGDRPGVRMFAALFLGYPLWWLVGVAAVFPLLLSLVMWRGLARRRVVLTPRGWAVWALFLLVVAVGVLLLGVDAPGAVPGGLGPGRLLVFGYRAGWYVASGVVLLWVFNTPSDELPTLRVATLFGWLYVIATVGGVAGLLFPHVVFPSLVEALLPGSVAHNALVQEIVHPGLADVQQVLGHDEARPKAPFPFTNTWGSAVALLLPFFVLSWWRHGRPWQRWAVPVVLATSAVPAVFSLNRGLWICLIAGFLILITLGVVRGRPQLLVGTVSLVVVAGILFAVSPLADLVVERLHNPHSNARRHSLAVETVKSVVAGSPVVGFGSTRNVQGNFSSLSGGATPGCPACASPPLGTQGQLWMVVFSQGLVGLGLFLAFLAMALSRTWRCRTELETVATLVLVFFGLQLFVYDTLGLPQFLVLVVVGLALREQRESGLDRRAATFTSWSRGLRAAFLPVAAVSVAGACLGAVVAALAPPAYTQQVDVLLPHTPAYIAEARPPSNNPVNDATIDSVASRVRADEVLGRVRSAVPMAAGQAPLFDRVRLAAPANTRVLQISVRARSAAEARRTVAVLVTTFLDDERTALEDRQRAALAEQPFYTFAHQAALRTNTSAGSVLREPPLVHDHRPWWKYGVSGAVIGLLLALAGLAILPGAVRRRLVRRA